MDVTLRKDNIVARVVRSRVATWTVVDQPEGTQYSSDIHHSSNDMTTAAYTVVLGQIRKSSF